MDDIFMISHSSWPPEQLQSYVDRKANEFEK